VFFFFFESSDYILIISVNTVKYHYWPVVRRHELFLLS